MKVRTLVLGGLSTLAMTSVPAFAGTKITVDDDTWVNIGAGIRSEFSIFEDGAPNEDNNSFDFDVATAQLFIGGQVNKHVGFTFNLNYNHDTDDIQLMDAILQFEKSEMLNVWFGRFLPPTDRANNSGPFYQNSWVFPLNSMFPRKVAGRDDGIAVWGSPNGGKFKYQVGLFEGLEPDSNEDFEGRQRSRAKDKPLLAARFTLNLWDPEPGYYSSSTYYGKKDILAVAFTVQMQNDAVEKIETFSSIEKQRNGDLRAWNLDFLLEKQLSTDAVVSAELAFYDRDTDDIRNSFVWEGDGFYFLLGYLLPKVNSDSLGHWQPKLRFETIDAFASETEILELDVGYIVDGHNTRFSFVLGNFEVDLPGASEQDLNYFGIGAQAIF